MVSKCFNFTEAYLNAEENMRLKMGRKVMDKDFKDKKAIEREQASIKASAQVVTPKSKVDGGGMRFNSNKAELHQVPTSAILAISKVLMYGAQKYEKGNFRRGMKWTTPYDCAQRHMMLWLDGEELDAESGLPHLYHAIANVAMLIEFETTCPELDDRFKGEVSSYEDSFNKYKFNKYVKPETNIREEDLDDMEKEFTGFKVGDRVRRINHNYHSGDIRIEVGDVFTVSSIDSDMRMLELEGIELNMRYPFDEFAFELIK